MTDNAELQRQIEKRPNLIIAELDHQRERKDGYRFNNIRRWAERLPQALDADRTDTNGDQP